jgi:phosphocarrier protein
MRQSIQVTIQNLKGLHARAAAKFVKTVEPFNARVEVKRAGEIAPGEEDHAGPVGGTSLLGLMMLGADKGTTLEVSAEGAGAEEVLARIRALIDGLFGEGE